MSEPSNIVGDEPASDGSVAAAAEARYREALARTPDDPDTLHQFGLFLGQTGRLDEAAEVLGRLVAVQPTRETGQIDLATVLHRLGRIDEAIACLRTAIVLSPGTAPLYHNLGLLLLTLDRADEAAANFQEAIAHDGELADAHLGLGLALRRLGRFDEAIAALGRALALRPGFAAAFNGLGRVASDLGQWTQAIDFHAAAIEAGGTTAQYFTDLGTALYGAGEIVAADGAFRTAIARHPGDVVAHFSLAAALLKSGRLAEGWPEYEWRRRFVGFPRLTTAQPEWRGEDIAGCTLLLYGEQGLGDSIMFGRYAALAAEQGARVILRVQPALVRLLSSLPGVAQVVPPSEAVEVHCHLPLLSAPGLFGTTLDTIPAACPYLSADRAATRLWAERLTAHPGLKVGLVWAGDPRPGDFGSFLIDRRRSLRLEQLAPLAAIPGVTLVSLQKGAGAGQVAAAGMPILDMTAELDDFADTAALVAALDLVISVDTSVAHLAGALGRPVWLLSRFDGCWRWLTDRDDSPWYPTMRLFRQPRPDDWAPTVAAVAAALRALAAGA